MVKSLCTRDIFLLINDIDEEIKKENVYLWVGKGISKDEEKLAIRQSYKILYLEPPETLLSSSNYPFQIIKEKFESE